MSEESCWVCPNCQAQVPSDCDTCPECGYSEAVDDLELRELEQKVKNLETDRDNLWKSLQTCTRNLNSYAKESVELKQKLQSPEFLEALAKLEHEQWMEWSKAIAPEINTAYYLPHLERWKKCWVPYSKLTEEQKEHDRVWARKIIEALLK